MKHLDLFTGYGGFTIAAQKKNWETVGHSEIDKYANAVLEYNFNIKNYGSVCDIDFRQFYGEVDIITGGTPCQDLSVAGKGKGLEGERSGLFFEFIRALTESEATYFVWENVKGALWSNKGWDFARVQIEMEQAGYDVWWQVINAKDFGVPQNRERIFAIGIRKGSGREILFEQRESGKDIIKAGDLDSDTWRKRNESIRRFYDPKGIAPTTPTAQGGGVMTKIVVPRKRRTEYSLQEESSTITSRYRGFPDGDGRPAVAIPNKNRRSQIVEYPIHTEEQDWKTIVPPSLYKQLSQEEKKQVIKAERIPLRFLTRNQKNIEGDYAYTVDSSNTGGVKEGMRIRRLTPTECERLMGLEDGWTSKGIMEGKEVDISDTQRYKMCGNGVVVQCVDYIFDLIE